MSIIGVRIDEYCDECGARQTTFTVLAEVDGVVCLGCDNCGHTVEMDPREFAEYLRD